MSACKSLSINIVKKVKLIIFFVLCILCVPAYSDFISCKEKVTNIHIHSNGNIYFNTEGVCAKKWCLLDWKNSENETQLNRAYSALLAARTTDRAITFHWPKESLAACGGTFQKSYPSPEWIDY